MSTVGADRIAELRAKCPTIDSRTASEVTGVPLRSIQSLAKQGRIPGAVQFGGRWRFNTELLLRACGVVAGECA